MTTPATTPAEPAADTPPVETPPVVADDTPPVETPPADGDTPPADGDTPPADDAPPADKDVPEAYADFKMPEGVELDASLLEKASPIFKELGLTQDQAQKLVDFQAGLNQDGQANVVQAFNEQVETWKTDSRNDKEFGGEKFEENLSIAKLAIETHGSPEFQKLLDDHAISSHPEFVRFALNVGKGLKQDVPGAGNRAPGKPHDRAANLYPND